MRKKTCWIIGLVFAAGIAGLVAKGLADPPPLDLHDLVWFTQTVVRDDLDNRDAFWLLIPNGYDHVFISGDGTQYIATNGDSFKPDSVGGNFQEIHNR